MNVIFHLLRNQIPYCGERDVSSAGVFRRIFHTADRRAAIQAVAVLPEVHGVFKEQPEQLRKRGHAVPGDGVVACGDPGNGEHRGSGGGADPPEARGRCSGCG